jgi:hypothetical protein
VSVNFFPPHGQLLNCWTNLYKTWYVYHGIEPISTAYFINPLHQSVYLCVFRSLLDKGTVKNYRDNKYTSNNTRIIGRFVLCTVRVTSKESGQLVVLNSICEIITSSCRAILIFGHTDYNEFQFTRSYKCTFSC